MHKVKKPFFKIKASNELLTDRGGLAVFDEYVQSTSVLDHVDRLFPWPGSNRGIPASSYFRVLGLHMFDGGRYLEEIRDLKDDKAFRKVLNLDRFPGPDAVGDWLRRHGESAMESDYFDHLMSKMLVQYLKATDLTDGYVLDMDASLIASDKGDGTKGYDGTIGYNPMLGFISDGRHKPFTTSLKFRQGYASPQSDQLTGIKHTHELLMRHGKKLKCVRIDSAGYMSDIINYCDEEHIHYTIVADHNSAVMNRVGSIPETDWQTFYVREGVDWGWEISETKYVLVKLMQLTVLPATWHHSMITSVRQKLFRTVARVVSSARQVWLAITSTSEKVKMLIQARGEIYALE